MILITTSDYYPQIGGLTSFTSNIVQVLTNINCEFELFHWKNYREIESYDQRKLEEYDLIINIHPMFSWLSVSGHEKMINFIHGSEILMTSPNILKRIIKNINKKKYFKRLESSKYNFFISEFTKNKIVSKGYSQNYSRDFIFHNCIDTSAAKKKISSSSDLVKLVCIARDVPHKNIEGAVRVAEILALLSNKKVQLTLSPGVNLSSTIVKVENLKSFSDEERSKTYAESDFNLLLSKDHSKLGFFEGFGLTTMEAAIFGTPSIVLKSGGLSEAVHHEINGFVIDEITESNLSLIIPYLKTDKYNQMSERAYEHVINNHSLYFYEKLITKLLGMNK